MVGQPEESLRRALELAFRRLNRRELTVHEMRCHLQLSGVDEPVIDGAVRELTRDGYLDDARFSRLFVEDRRMLDQWGAERIRRTLRGRGIARELIEAALEQPEHSESELERAVAVLQRRFASPPRERRERDRALGVLLRKGYDGELALDAIAAYASGD